MYGPDFIERPDLDASLTEGVKQQILEGVVEILPALEDATILEHRGDLLAMAPTPPHHKPVMGRLPRWQNGYVAARFAWDGEGRGDRISCTLSVVKVFDIDHLVVNGHGSSSGPFPLVIEIKRQLRDSV